MLRWGIQLAAHLSESTAWAIYRDRLKRFGSLIGDRNTGHWQGEAQLLTTIALHRINYAGN
jgi:hypothetical protein